MIESGSNSLVSVVIPVYNEDQNIATCLRALRDALARVDHEILVCYDFEEDRTLPAINAMPDKPPQVRLVRNDLGRGVAWAMRAGFREARGDVVVTTMADLSDSPEVIPQMARKIREEGAAVVSGSRYMKGGAQVGGPRMKGALSRLAGWSLYWIAGVPTRDVTNNFRAYRTDFARGLRIQSVHGFELGLELTVKAHLQGLKVAEVPSRWNDRVAGQSRFRLLKWLPFYLRWYGMALLAPVLIWSTVLGFTLWSLLWSSPHSSGHNAWIAFGTAIFTAILVILARRARGRMVPADILFPAIVFLSSRRWSAATTTFLVSAGAGVLLAGLLLLLLTRRRGPGNSSESPTGGELPSRNS